MKPLILPCALAFGTLGQGLAQELERPWEDWEPPAVEMPEPNAFQLYQEAFGLMEEYGEVDLQDDPEALREGTEQHRLTFRLLQEAMMGECRLPPVIEPNQPLQHLSGFRKAARLLLEAGADVNARDTSDQTPLHWAASGGHLELAELLLEHGADVNAASRYGQTPLHLAAEEGRTEVGQLLLEAGAEVNAQDQYDLTPLSLAEHLGNTELAALLRQHGAKE